MSLSIPIYGFNTFTWRLLVYKVKLKYSVVDFLSVVKCHELKMLVCKSSLSAENKDNPFCHTHALLRKNDDVIWCFWKGVLQLVSVKVGNSEFKTLVNEAKLDFSVQRNVLQSNLICSKLLIYKTLYGFGMNCTMELSLSNFRIKHQNTRYDIKVCNAMTLWHQTRGFQKINDNLSLPEQTLWWTLVTVKVKRRQLSRWSWCLFHCSPESWALTVNITSTDPSSGHGEDTHEVVDVATRQHHILGVGGYLALLHFFPAPL